LILQMASSFVVEGRMAMQKRQVLGRNAWEKLQCNGAAPFKKHGTKQAFSSS
jgi:hypothetical protein